MDLPYRSMSWESFLAVLFGGIVGVTLGATGAGGSLLAIPLLVYGLGLPVQEATATSLLVVAASAGLGAYGHLRTGNVRLKAAALFSASGWIGAWLGALAHRLVREELILILFGVLMLAVAWRMWQGHTVSAMDEGPRCADEMPRRCVIRALVVGLLAGVVTGLFGVGGGFVIVPALSMILGFPMQTAVGTSLLIIAIVSLGGLLGHVQQGRLDWLVTGLLLLGSGLGMLAGTEVARRIPPARLAKQFAVVAAAVAAGLILHNGIALSWGAR